jgi:aryl-alcohol dehydrogenase-like predicted oxidoreductase
MNVGVLARVPFDEGSLTGSITEASVFPPDDFRSMYFQGDRKKQVVEHISALERDLGITRDSLAEIALRYTITHPAVTSTIPGMRTVRNVERNAAVPDKGSLDEATLKKLKRHAWDRNFYD